MSETDIADFAFIVEQIFVGLLQNYTKDLLGVEATDEGEIPNRGIIATADVDLKKRYRTALHAGFLPDEEEQVDSVGQQLIDAVNLAGQQDDLSDAEGIDEDLSEGDRDEGNDDSSMLRTA
ncbi:hypothetical protein HBI56_032880 [Parastagonospora nodorum]|uniref:Uncharacterized protein n=1 Tax=Phaeosphaeria nodorum (strain SN15 / ATCC MYA-4574 / FGSC 10173) TaxID=321614 RepID=A0A7U2I121_PHANO|nr:hypothetical protein HBH56_020680 [Parastagonospora nodorum]QRC95442.1 hypothetical protein JI435_432260 [Parastagonospora nodorum SN15]KAH3936860.1 hypothetical protein HBH54_013830 [Parastagonospora nodorum]KAH3944018.1 hypothetical protein HBH53_162930 [Parastagonospora nodorum]KAH3967628.1 hypothetical protein HBH51_137550 [Parastagonospora nodorum]